MPRRELSSPGPSCSTAYAMWLMAARSVGCIVMRRARAVEASEPAVARSRSATVSGACVGRPEAPLLDGPPIRRLYGGDRLLRSPNDRRPGSVHRPGVRARRGGAGSVSRFGDPARHTADCVPVTREWRNGRRAGFRCQCPKGRGGSNPPSRTRRRRAPSSWTGPLRCRGPSSSRWAWIGDGSPSRLAARPRAAVGGGTSLRSVRNGARCDHTGRASAPGRTRVPLARQGWTMTLPTLWPESTRSWAATISSRSKAASTTTVRAPSATSSSSSRASSARSGAGPALTWPRAPIVCHRSATASRSTPPG